MTLIPDESARPEGGFWYRPGQAADSPEAPAQDLFDRFEFDWEQEGGAAAPARGRVLVAVLFGCALATSVGLWWADTPSSAITSTGEVFIAGGRITGLIAGFLLLTQVLLMSRVGALERWLGSHTLTTWHRDLGGALVVAVLLHVVLTLTGYSGGLMAKLPGVTWMMLNAYQDMISATVATGILLAVGLLAIRAIRRSMRYEVWLSLHLTTYLVLLLSYGHMFANGQQLMHAGFGRRYWAGLYFFVVGCLAWGRVVRPVLLNLRHRLRVMTVVAEAPGVVSVYIGGRHLDQMKVRAGHYFRWRFLTRGCWWQSHPFSLSAAPNGAWLRLTVKVVGDHTSRLRSLRPGVPVLADGPSGVFTADHRVRPGALLIAGGSGIAPIRALLEELPVGAVVVYRASSDDDLVFRDELEWLAHNRRARIHYVIGPRHAPGPQRAFTVRGMREIVPDVRRRDVYLCGPEGLVQASLQVLRRMHVPRRQIHLDPFEF